jgi:hypothetical protein
MKGFKWLALAGFLATGGCGSDDSISPSEDLADAWVGEYSGTGSYALSNGESGVEKPTTMVIEAISPKQVTVVTKLVYGSGRGEEVSVFALLEPVDPDRITIEYRSVNSRTVFALVKEDGTISGSIVTSSLRHGGSWTEDQRIVDIELVKQ